MDFRRLQCFVAVAEAGAIGRAADRLGVAQPSLSQQVRRLEDELGAPLFDRLARGVALTDAGRALLPRARRILAEVRETEARLRADVDAGAGWLSVGAIPTMAPYLLPPALATLRDEYPGCEITVREDLTERLVEAVVDNELDVAVMSTPVEHDLVEVDVLGREELLVVVPAVHPLAGAGEIALPDLRREPAVTLHEMHCLGQQITGFCVSRRVARRVACRTTQLSTVLEFVRMGLGVSLVPAMAADADNHPERAYLRLKRSPPTREIALVTRRDRTRPRAADRLAALLTLRLSG